MSDAWIQTFTGRRFYPLAPRVEDVCIEDIAHALSLKCRYGGHCKRFYSVAEHSVLVSRHVAAPYRLEALLHDAAEAYSPFGDVPRPVKHGVPFAESLWEIESAIDFAIHAAFRVLPHSADHDEIIKRVDNAILADERDHLMAPMAESAAEWGAPEPPLGIVEFPCWPPNYAERVFLSEFRKLTAEDES